MSLAKLFSDLGVLVRIRQCAELVINGGSGYTADSISQLRIESDAVFDEDATGLLLHGSVDALLTAWQNSQNNIMAAADSIAVDVLRNRAVDLIGGTAVSGDIFGLCGELANYMRDNSKYVLQSTVAAGAVTAGGTNAGGGTWTVSVLNPWGDTSNNQAVQNQDFSAYCYADSYTGGTEVNAELFRVSGSFQHQLEGIQNCLYPAADGRDNVGGGNRLQNEDASTPGNGGNTDTTIPFENFTTHTPDGWTVNTGTPGTNINLETTEKYLGSNSLEFLGDVGATLMDISQDANDFYGSSATDQALEPGARYVHGFYLKAESGLVAGVIEGLFEGTAYSAGATEKATKDMSSSPPTTWTLYTGVAKMPKAVPADMKYTIQLTTALTNGKALWIDAAFCAKLHYVPAWGCYIHFTGSSTPCVSTPHNPDRWKWSTTNDHAGLFQEWFSRKSDPQEFQRTKYCDIQMPLPADSPASADCAESKAQ